MGRDNRVPENVGAAPGLGGSSPVHPPTNQESAWVGSPLSRFLQPRPYRLEPNCLSASFGRARLASWASGLLRVLRGTQLVWHHVPARTESASARLSLAHWGQQTCFLLDRQNDKDLDLACFALCIAACEVAAQGCGMLFLFDMLFFVADIQSDQVRCKPSGNDARAAKKQRRLQRLRPLQILLGGALLV